MKLKLLYLIFTMFCLFAKAQIPTNDLSKSYLFTNLNLTNTVNAGTYDLLSSNTNNTQATTDPGNNILEAIDLNNSSFIGGQHPTGTGDFSISFWIKTTSTGFARIINQYNNNSTFNAGYFLSLINTGALSFTGSFRYGSNYSNQVSVTSNLVNDGNWHHIVITGALVTRVQNFPTGGSQTYNSYRYTIYQDNTMVQAVSTSEIIEAGSQQVFLFSNSPDLIIGSSQYADQIDNYREYTRILTSTEINSLFNEFTPNRIYIDKDATGNNDGTNWQDAYTDISNALINAQNNYEVWIKGGVYVPNTTGNNSVGINVFATGLKIYGSFAGTETQISERIYGSNSTIITGDVNGDDGVGIPSFTQSTTSTSDNIGILMRISEFSNTEKTVIDGITFTRSYQQNGAGALFLAGGNYPNISITNCNFTFNLHEFGGAIYSNYLVGFTSQFSSELGIDINQSIFDSNVARIGAGIFLVNQDDNLSRFVNAEITVSNSLFSNNVVTDNPMTIQGVFGSAIRIFQGDPQSIFTTKLNNNTFANNRELGTVLPANMRYVVTLEASVPSYQIATLTNNIFWDNTTTGGATASSVGSDVGFTSDITLTNNLGEDNFSNIPASQQTNSINGSPLFVNTVTNDFRLQSTSPAIDTGFNTANIELFDLLNNARIFNTNVDMGAYEFNPSLSSQDFQDFQDTDAIKIYPNPTTSVININSSSAIKNIEIYSILGKKVMSLNSKIIDVSYLKTGLYLIKIEDLQGTISTQKFLKK